MIGALYRAGNCAFNSCCILEETRRRFGLVQGADQLDNLIIGGGRLAETQDLQPVQLTGRDLMPLIQPERIGDSSMRAIFKQRYVNDRCD
jgi:hypothetical protein